jgi:hypothetical protein
MSANRMNPIALRFIVAGLAIAAGGVAIVITKAGVGDEPEWKGAIVVLAGAGLVLSGWLRRHGVRPPDELPTSERSRR